MQPMQLALHAGEEGDQQMNPKAILKGMKMLGVDISNWEG